MIFATIIITSLVTQAKVMDVIQARSLKELIYQTIDMADKSIERKKCQIELNDGFIPVHCYIWLNQEPLSQPQKRRMVEWLDQSCLQAITQQQQSPEYATHHIKVLSLSCRQALKDWSEEWLYKMSKENKEKFFKKISEG